MIPPYKTCLKFNSNSPEIVSEIVFLQHLSFSSDGAKKRVNKGSKPPCTKNREWEYSNLICYCHSEKKPSLPSYTKT